MLKRVQQDVVALKYAFIVHPLLLGAIYNYIFIAIVITLFMQLLIIGVIRRLRNKINHRAPGIRGVGLYAYPNGIELVFLIE